VTTKKHQKERQTKKTTFFLQKHHSSKDHESKDASFFFTRNKTARLIKTWKKLWHDTLTQANSPENVKTNRLVVVLSDSEISELFHFQIIGDILDMFWLSQHDACLPNKQTNKTVPTSSKFLFLRRSSTKSSFANCSKQNFLLPPQSARNKGKL